MRKKIRLMVCLSPDLKEKLVAKSKKLDCSMAELLRNSFIRFLEADK